MEASTKRLLIITGIIGVGAAIYFIATRDKEGSGGENKSKGKGSKCKDGTLLDMGYLQNGYIHIHGDDRVKGTPLLNVGAKIEIIGASDDMNGDRTIAAIWKDANGNVGAFKTTEFSIGYDSKQVRTYEKVAKICVKK